jgi:hypothetical protein
VSVQRSFTCDGCGTEAPAAHCHGIPAKGWHSLIDERVRYLDACSWRCVAEIAQAQLVDERHHLTAVVSS